MRRGIQSIKLLKDSIVWHSYNSQSVVEEIHRHKYIFNPIYKKYLNDSYFVISGIDKETENIVEVIEANKEKSSDFIFLTQYHPEFNTTLCNPSKVFTAFLNRVILMNGFEDLNIIQGFSKEE